MRRMLFATTAVLLLGGCLQVETTMELQRDLSGTASLSIEVDLESMVYVMASITHTFSGEEGPPTEQELADARAELMSEQDTDEFDPVEARAEIEPRLPDGVRLRDISYEQVGLRTSYRIEFAFDHIEQLKDVDLSDPDEDPEAMADPTASTGKAFESPFEDLELVDEGATWLLRTPPTDPVGTAEEESGGMEGMEELMGLAFKGLQVRFAFTPATEVVAHNATRVDGRTLHWEYDLTDFMGEEKQAADEGIWLRFRK